MKNTVLLLLLLLFAIKGFSANYYWVGGNGKWSEFQQHWALSSGGKIFHTQIPGSMDNVYFDSQSFPVSKGNLVLDLTTIPCASMNWSTGSKEITISALYPNTKVSIYNSFLLDAGVIFPEGLSINLKSSSGIQTLSTHGAKTIKSSIVFDGIGGKWQVTDSLAFSLISITNGELTAAGKTIRTNAISNSGKLSLTNSIIYTNGFFGTNNSGSNNILSGSKIISNGNINLSTGGVPLNIDTLYASGDELTLGNTNINYAKVNTSIFNIKGANTIQTLISTAEKIVAEETLTVSNFLATGLSTLNITEKLITSNATLTGNSCSDYITINGGEWKQSSGTVNLNYAQVKNLTCTGGANFKASNSIDLGNNTGISITQKTASTYYWIGGSGSWSDPAHWSLSSGGTPANCIPAATDNVVINQLSDNNSEFTITISSYSNDPNSYYCKDLNITSLDNLCYINGDLLVYGSISVSKNAKGSLSLHCLGSQAHTIDIKSNFNINTLDIDCKGSYSLLDSISLYQLVIRKGTFSTNGKKVSTGAFYNRSIVPYQATLNLSSSEIFIQDELMFYADAPFNFNPGTSHIYLNGNNFASPSDYSFYNLTINGAGENLLSAECTFNKITMNAKTNILTSLTTDTLHIQAGNTILFDENTNTVIQKRLAVVQFPKGCPQFTKLQCMREGSARFTSASAQISINNTAIENITASGGATFFASNSILNENTKGWTNSPYVPKNLYWVGSSGQWDDPSHWAITSGGAASGCDVPTEADNVIIDNHSGSHVTCVIDLGTTDRNILSLNINSLVDSVRLIGSKLILRGDLHLHHLTDLHNLNYFEVIGNQTSTITTDNSFFSNLLINNKGITHFTDNIKGVTLEIKKGKSILTNMKINLVYLFIGHIDSLIVDLSNSTINTHDLRLGSDSLNLITKGTLLFLENRNWSAAYLSYSPNTYSPNRVSFDSIIVINNSVIATNQTDFYINVVNLDIGTFIIPTFNRANLEMGYCNIGNLIASPLQFAISGIYPFNAGSNKISFFQLESPYSYINGLTVGYFKIRPGSTLELSNTGPLNITEYLDIVGTSSAPITIKSKVTGSRATISKSTGSVCAAYLNLSDINATGGAAFIAGPSSVNVSNSIGWNFATSCTPIVADYVKPLCNENDLQLTATAPVNVTGFLWNGPNSFVTNTQNPLITNKADAINGLYTLQAGGEIRKVFVTRIHNPSDSLKMSESEITYTPGPANTQNFDYTWYYNGTELSGYKTASIYEPQNGDYYAIVKTLEGNCQTKTKTVTYNDGSFLYTPVITSGIYNIDTHAIIITWTDNNTADHQYQLERSDNQNGFYFPIATIDNGINNYADNSIIANLGDQYYYRIKAINLNYESGYSNEAEVKIEELTTSLESDVTKQKILVYMNLPQNDLIVTAPDLINKLSIMDLTGKVVLSKESNIKTESVQLSSLANGIYLISIETTKGREVRRFIK